jgi:hypothetical protein
MIWFVIAGVLVIAAAIAVLHFAGYIK